MSRSTQRLPRKVIEAFETLVLGLFNDNDREHFETYRATWDKLKLDRKEVSKLIRSTVGDEVLFDFLANLNFVDDPMTSLPRDPKKKKRPLRIPKPKPPQGFRWPK